MELTKDLWVESDIAEFEKFLISFSKGEYKGSFEKRIINTQLHCIAVPSFVVNDIVRKISKGNFISFIDLWVWNNFTETSIIGKLISKIKNFNLLKKYLTIYANKADNWATCDCLKLNITENNKNDFYNFSLELIKSPKPFVKRIGLNIIMKLINFEKYLDRIFAVLNSFKTETEYYVNMMIAWIVCECFTKHRDKTFAFLKTHNLNKFTINKAISKCRDSFRVTKEDKETLLMYKET